MDHPKLIPEPLRRLDELKKREKEIEAAMSKLQGLPSLSQLKDGLLAVRQQIDRLR